MNIKPLPTDDIPRDHGGGIDAARARFGGSREDWLDLSTGINPAPYPIPTLPNDAWTALPDKSAQTELLDAARRFWNVPEGAAILAASGASALISRLPDLFETGRVDIPTPTYNEHAAAFDARGWEMSPDSPDVRVLVHPNNPTGRLWSRGDLTAPMTIIDESFGDVVPEASLIGAADGSGVIILKSFGKFWGLAGMRLGFAIGSQAHIARLAELLGPWPVSGPAIATGIAALNDVEWATATRTRLQADADRLDGLVTSKGARVVGGTTLFRLYEVDNAADWKNRLAQRRIWTRIFPYSRTFIRLGLPAPDRWHQLETAL